MEKLAEADELLVSQFRCVLEQAVSVDDMFPPEDGVPKSMAPNRPKTPPALMCSEELVIT